MPITICNRVPTWLKTLLLKQLDSIGGHREKPQENYCSSSSFLGFSR